MKTPRRGSSFQIYTCLTEWRPTTSASSAWRNTDPVTKTNALQSPVLDAWQCSVSIAVIRNVNRQRPASLGIVSFVRKIERHEGAAQVDRSMISHSPIHIVKVYRTTNRSARINFRAFLNRTSNTLLRNPRSASTACLSAH